MGRRGENDLSPSIRFHVPTSGFSLVELVITIAVMAILTLGAIPLIQVSVKRQKEQQLHEALRQVREAIDQFHREALAGAQMQANQQQGQPNNQPNPNNTGSILADPRVRVFITDQTLFSTNNPDRYPPDLETLVKGVDVLPLATNGLGGAGNPNVNATSVGGQQIVPKTKVYLRQIPIDPMTGKADWVFRSCYDPAESTSSGGENVFDVHSKSDGVPLDGKGKYSDW